MGFWANQTRSVIEWKDASPDVLIWRWDGTNDELKNGSKLIVNPGQAAIFLYEGEIKAIHDYPGKFELGTGNVPFLTTIKNIMQNFTSEHKANIYFVRTTEFVDQKWGTTGPIKYDDPKYRFPVGMIAHGNFSFHITDIRNFFVNFSSNTEVVTIASIRKNIIGRILAPMTSVFAKSGYSYSEIDSHIQELSDLLSQAVAPDFAKLGFEMSDFRIERTDFDEKTHERIDKIADKMAEAQGDAAKVNEFANINGAGIANYATMEQLRALNAAAANQNGMAGMGVGMGLGAGLGAGMGFGGMNMMNNQIQQPQAAPQVPQVPTVACKGCGAQIKATAKFCPECGKPQTQAQKCPECGAEVEGKFCPECGHKM